MIKTLWFDFNNSDHHYFNKSGGIAALYLLSPFDIVPEAAFGIFGLLDDLVIVALFLIYASILYRNFVVET